MSRRFYDEIVPKTMVAMQYKTRMITLTHARIFADMLMDFSCNRKAQLFQQIICNEVFEEYYYYQWDPTIMNQSWSVIEKRKKEEIKRKKNFRTLTFKEDDHFGRVHYTGEVRRKNYIGKPQPCGIGRMVFHSGNVLHSWWDFDKKKFRASRLNKEVNENNRFMTKHIMKLNENGFTYRIQ